MSLSAQYTTTNVAFRLTDAPATGSALPDTDPSALGNRPGAAYLQADTHDIRFTTDGTAPTSLIGTLLVAGAEPFYYAAGPLNALRFIQTESGSKLNVVYSQNPLAQGNQGFQGAQGAAGSQGAQGAQGASGGGGGGVDSFNTRTGAVTLALADLAALGVAPGTLSSAEILFTEGAVVGVYESSVLLPAGSVIADVLVYGLQSPWSGLASGDAVLDVFDSNGAWIYQLDLIELQQYNPNGTGKAYYNNFPAGWMSAGRLVNEFAPDVGGTGDYQGRVMWPNMAGDPIVAASDFQDVAKQGYLGPGRRLATSDTMTARVTTLTVDAPNGITLVKILYFAAQTPSTPIFTPTP